MQSKLSSFIESLINILIGYGVALGSHLVIFPHYGVNLPLHENMIIGCWFTIISLVRSYIIRRWFNRILHNASQKMAGNKNA